MSNAVMKPEANSTATREKELWLAPEVDIHETADGYLLHAEMPGVGKDGLEVTVDNNQLTIEGRRNTVPEPGEVIFRESRDANYRRVFELNPAVDTSRIAAKVEQGLLTLRLPKAERVKPKRISIEG